MPAHLTLRTKHVSRQLPLHGLWPKWRSAPDPPAFIVFSCPKFDTFVQHFGPTARVRIHICFGGMLIKLERG